MKCKRVKNFILYGVPKNYEAEMENLKTHAEHCSDCASELRVYSRLMDGFTLLGAFAPPAGLRKNILANVAPRTMQCKEVLSLIPAYIDESLSYMDSDSVKKHFKSCEACKMEYQKNKALLDSLAAFEEVEPPAWVTESVLSYTKKNKDADVFGFPWKIKSAWSLAVAVVCLMLLTFIPKDFGTQEVDLLSVTKTALITTSSAVADAKVSIKRIENQRMDVDFNVVPGRDLIGVYGRNNGGLKRMPSQGLGNLKTSAKHSKLDTVKVVNNVAKEKKQDTVIARVETKSVIPKIEDTKFILVENEPVKYNSEPEIVASSTDYNVNSNYVADETEHFEAIAAKVQTKNSIDNWMSNSMNSQNSVHDSKKSANIPLFDIKF